LIDKTAVPCVKSCGINAVRRAILGHNASVKPFGKDRCLAGETFQIVHLRKDIGTRISSSSTFTVLLVVDGWVFETPAIYPSSFGAAALRA
jgi:hypothetical protein